MIGRKVVSRSELLEHKARNNAEELFNIQNTLTHHDLDPEKMIRIKQKE